MAYFPEPIVIWPMPLSHAIQLYEFLHYNRAGGYQYDHDVLAEAIVKTETGTTKRTKDGYVEVRSAEQILAQFRQCALDAEAAADEDEWDFVHMHHQNATDSAVDLDNLLTDNKTAPLPVDWQRATTEQE